MREIAALLVLSGGVSGCIINAPDLDELLDTGSSGDWVPTSVTGATTTTTTTTTSTSTSTSTESGSEGSEGSETGEVESVCEPQPQEVASGVIVDGKPGWDHEHTELVVPCVVTWAGELGTAMHVGLACQDGSHTLDVADVGPLEVFEGDTVELSLFIDVVWWANVYVALRKDGELVLAAMEGDALPGSDDGTFYPPEEFWAPLQLALLSEVCEPEPDPNDVPCNFICPASCTRDQRMALAFVEDGQADVVYDAGSGELGDLVIVVGSARAHVETYCTDTPSAWLDFVAVR